METCFLNDISNLTTQIMYVNNQYNEWLKSKIFKKNSMLFKMSNLKAFFKTINFPTKCRYVNKYDLNKNNDIIVFSFTLEGYDSQKNTLGGYLTN